MRTSLAVAYIAVAFGTPASAGSLPEDDVGMMLRIEATSDPQFRVGTQAVLAFDVTRYGPSSAGGYSIAAHELQYGAGGRAIELSVYPGSTCNLIDISDSTSPPLLEYGLSGSGPGVGSTTTCRVRLKVNTTPVGNVFEFKLFGHDPESGGSLPDPNPANNIVRLPIGSGSLPRAVPALSTCALFALLVALVTLVSRRTRHNAPRAS